MRKKILKKFAEQENVINYECCFGGFVLAFFHNESGQAVKQAPRKAVSFLSLEEGSSKLG